MRVWIGLAHANSAVIVVAVVDSTLTPSRGHHPLSLLGIVHVLHGTGKGPGFGIQGNHRERAVPVVHREHVLGRLVNGQVTGRGASGVDGSSEFEEFTVTAHLVGKYLSIVLNVFGARVHHVEVGMVPRKGWIDRFLRRTGQIQQYQTAIAGVEAIHRDRVLRDRAAGTVRETIKVAVTGDKEQLVAVYFNMYM